MGWADRMDPSLALTKCGYMCWEKKPRTCITPPYLPGRSCDCLERLRIGEAERLYICEDGKSNRGWPNHVQAGRYISPTGRSRRLGGRKRRRRDRRLPGDEGLREEGRLTGFGWLPALAGGRGRRGATPVFLISKKRVDCTWFAVRAAFPKSRNTSQDASCDGLIESNQDEEVQSSLK